MSVLSSKSLWEGTSGPPAAPIVLVGEAWGATEAAERRPFVGESGVELNRMLASAGLQRDDILCLNTVSERPPNNDLYHFFYPKAEAPAGSQLRGLNPHPVVLDHLRRLHSQLTHVPRRLILAVGNYALWALTGVAGTSTSATDNSGRSTGIREPSGITTWRGSMLFAPRGPLDAPILETSDVPLLPLIHPAAVLRQWSLRSLVVHDLRARVPLALSGDWRPSVPPTYLAPPSYEDCLSLLYHWRDKLERDEVTLSCDIETARGLITCLGMADSSSRAISIPFIRREGAAFDSWWPREREARITSLLAGILQHVNIRVVGQNFLYDTQYIEKFLGVRPRLAFDTMLAQNVMFPGTPKDLSHLSSLYCRHHWHWKEDHKEWDMRGDVETLLRYNAQDCVRTFEIFERQQEVLASRGLEPQMTLKMRINDFCHKMMQRGVLFDTKRRHMVSLALEEALTETQRQLLQIIPQRLVDPEYPESMERALKTKTGANRKNGKYVFWYTSAKQTRQVFYELLRLPVVKDRKTKQPTVGKEARSELRRKAPEWTRLFDLLSASESMDNAFHVINSPLDPDGRMRCFFAPGGTETHRLSSSKNAFGRGTNLQNLTSGKEDDL